MIGDSGMRMNYEKQSSNSLGEIEQKPQTGLFMQIILLINLILKYDFQGLESFAYTKMNFYSL